jgi:DNA invertase Pin-like site-specific DNA recombinase
MPKRKERRAGYIRESDPTLANSVTIESAAKAVRLYCDKEGYEYAVEHEYKEALSAYMIPYLQRPELLNLLAAAKRKEFDVVVLPEIRSLSRRQVEVFVIYDMLQKYGIRIETVKEKFSDDAMGRAILGHRAAFAEIEREQSYARMQRGKMDRRAIGNAPNGHPKPAYGYTFVATAREVKGAYVLNQTIIYVDADGVSWSEYTVMRFVFEQIKKGISLRGVATLLNDIGIPAPMKAQKGIAHWEPGAIHRMISNPIYIGEVYANRYKKVGKKTLCRPREEWEFLGNLAPALIDRETFEKVQKQLAINKQNAIRSNTHDTELGLLRSGYIFCGVCGRRMQVLYPSGVALTKHYNSPVYRCRQSGGGKAGTRNKHNTQIHMTALDVEAWQKVLTVLKSPELIRQRVQELREKNKPHIDKEAIEDSIETISQEIENLFTLARHATNDSTMQRLTLMLKDLEKQKRDAEAFLYDVADAEEERQVIEKDLARFEQWVDEVRPCFTDPLYQPTYEERRLAVRMIGIKVTVYPSKGGAYPYRYDIDVTVPEVMEKGSLALQSTVG